MRIDNMGNLPHHCSKKSNKPWETFRPHKCNLRVIGITQFPVSYAFHLLAERSLALSVPSLEGVVGSNKIPPFPSLWRPNKCISCSPSPNFICFNPHFGGPLWTLGSSGEANTRCHLTNSEVISKVSVSLASVSAI